MKFEKDHTFNKVKAEIRVAGKMIEEALQAQLQGQSENSLESQRGRVPA